MQTLLTDSVSLKINDRLQFNHPYINAKQLHTVESTATAATGKNTDSAV
jgi:hypothetical protein